MRFFRFLVLISWFFPLNCFAQFYESGQDPASIRWKQINTPHARLIFPSGFDSAANRLANVFDFIYYNNSKGLEASPRKISVVLHNHSSYSNGFVTIAPRRMELFTTPPQMFTAQDWLSELAVHEYRHVVQTGKVNKGITRILYPFSGQLSSGMVAAMLPLWFMEGDAVYAETMLTNSGRGRAGDFTMQVKSLLGERDHLFSFEKALFGSYKDYVPNHYYSGYYMVSAIRAKYGSDVFAKCIDYTTRNPYLPFSFSHSLKRQTGKTARNLYKEVFTEIKQGVADSMLNRLIYRSFADLTPQCFTSYNYPQVVNDTTIIAVKSGLDDIRKFVFQYKDGNEKIIYTPGNYYDTRFSYSCGKIAWSEEIPDLRWQNRSYSCIKIWDLQKRSLKWLSHKSRYFAAALSRDALKVATVEITLENKCYLVVLDAITGDIINRTEAPDNLLISDPAFASVNNTIVAVVTGDPGKALYRFSLSSGNWEQLTAFSFHNISCPSEFNGTILFSADYTGANNLFALKKHDRFVYQISNSKYGAFEPFLGEKDSEVFFSEYSSNGYTTKWLKLDSLRWSKYKVPRLYSDSLISFGVNAENFNFQDSLITNPSIVSRQHLIKPYSRLAHAFNVHSWSPFYYDYSSLSFDNQNVFPGITLLSQDKLSTCMSSVSYFNQEGAWYLKPRIIYKGLYPVIDVSVNYGGSIPYYERFNKPAPSENGFMVVNTLIYVPFNLTRNKFISAVTPHIEIDYDNTRMFYTKDSTYRKGRTFASFGLNVYSYLKTSDRDIAPKIGFYVTAKIKYTPFDKVQYGYITYIKPRIYLPGLLPHHSLQLAGVYQYQNPRTYIFRNMVPFARGYYTAETASYKLAALWVDYSFPVFYPDWNIGPLLYFKRLRANLFFDYAQNKYRGINYNYKSIGMDWLTDFHTMRVFFPFVVGLRTIYLPKEQVILNQFIFNINFSF